MSPKASFSGLTYRPLYAKIGNSRTIIVERAFMKHTFHVAFASHLGLKRKYCFSVGDQTTRIKWHNLLSRQMKATALAHSQPVRTTQDRIRQAAQTVSLQVLRDAVIPSAQSSTRNDTLSPTTPLDAQLATRTLRLNSTSIVYGEDDPSFAERGLTPIPQAHADASDGLELGGILPCQTGKELVLLCRQNSLLPGLLELLTAGSPDTHVPPDRV